MSGGVKALKLIRQTEATECGLACLAMIANGFGHNLSLAAMRDKSGVSLRGSTLAHLARAAQRLALEPKGLSGSAEDLRKISLPAILHWDKNHFVVLEKFRGGKALILDPADGRTWMSISDLSEHFSGSMLTLSKAVSFSPISDNQRLRLRDMLSGLPHLGRALFAIAVLSLLFQAAVLLLPLFIRYVIDDALPASNTGLVIALAIGFGGIAIVRALSEALRSWAVLSFGHRLSFEMIGGVLAHLLRLPLSFFERRHVGDLISRMNSTQPLQLALTRDGVAFIIDVIMVLVTGVVMFLISSLMALIVLASAIMAMLISLAIFPKMRNAQEASLLAKARENTHVIETIRSATAIRLFSREAQREISWRQLYADYANSAVSYGKWVIAQAFSDRFIFGLQSVAIIAIGAWLIIEGTGALSIGLLFAFLMYRQLFSDAASRLLSKGLELRLLGLHLERLSDIVLAKEEAKVSSPAKLAKSLGDIRFENVSFRYSPSDPFVLSNMNFTIPAGKLTTISGPSGSGKTTLLKLLLGLYRPTEGQILIGGVNLADLDMQDWRKNLGVLMQDDALLSGTIAENISFFDDKLDMDAVIRSAKLAQIHDEIAHMPMNYMSLVGDMGSSLSGGQRQRVLLARSFYHNPEAILLDEGTANLDKVTEVKIAKILRNLQKTRIIIAHSPIFEEFSDLNLRVNANGTIKP